LQGLKKEVFPAETQRFASLEKIKQIANSFPYFSFLKTSSQSHIYSLTLGCKFVFAGAIQKQLGLL
jgi:hypothetical protein